MEEYEGVDWVRISDEVPVDEDAVDTVLQRFQTSAPGALSAKVSEDDEPIGADAEEEEPPPPVIEGESEEAGDEEIQRRNSFRSSRSINRGLSMSSQVYWRNSSPRTNASRRRR